MREYLNLGEKESDKSVQEIENQIDEKNSEIRDIFAGNLSSVISHYIKYQ